MATESGDTRASERRPGAADHRTAGMTTASQTDVLAHLGSVVALCAHPDDESFGLGAVIDALGGMGVATSVISFTRGENSTLRLDAGDLGAVREAELEAAGRILGTRAVRLFDYADGALAAVDVDELVDKVAVAAGEAAAGGLLAFDDGGITGHPDHQRATDAAVAAGYQLGLPVLAWALPRPVADSLNARFAAGFVGRDSDEVDFALTVDRERQRRAIAAHASQATGNEVLWHRLELMGAVEWLRWLRPPR